MWRKETIKNKIYALVLIGIGALSILPENDATAFIFFCLIGVPLFFAKENWIMDGGGSDYVYEESRRESVRIASNCRRKESDGYEIRRQLAEYDLKHANELDAMILWHLHEEFGFGPKRLKQFYDTFAVRLDELIKHYEMTDSDMVWLCTYKLKQYGIDIEEWNKQRRD